MKTERAFWRHTVTSTDTIEGIALNYSVTPSEIRTLNHLHPSDPLQLRKYVNIPYSSKKVPVTSRPSSVHTPPSISTVDELLKCVDEDIQTILDSHPFITSPKTMYPPPNYTVLRPSVSRTIVPIDPQSFAAQQMASSPFQLFQEKRDSAYFSQRISKPIELRKSLDVMSTTSARTSISLTRQSIDSSGSRVSEELPMTTFLLGFVLAKKKLFPLEGSRVIVTLLINFLYPAVNFTSVVRRISVENIGEFGFLWGACIIYILIGLALGALIQKLTHPPPTFKYGPAVACSLGNWGDFPIAIVMSVCSSAPFQPSDAQLGIAYISAFLICGNIYSFTFAYRMIAMDVHERHKDELPRVEKTKKNEQFQLLLRGFFCPINVSIYVGLMICIFKWQSFLIPNQDMIGKIDQEPFLYPIFQSIEFLAGAGVPMGLINLGAAIGRLSSKFSLPKSITLSISLVRLVILPIIGTSIVHLLTLYTPFIDMEDRVLRLVLMLQSGTPSANMCVFLTQHCSPTGDAKEMSSVIFTQYCLCAISTVIFLMIIMMIL